MWYEVPEPPPANEKPKALFPWEVNQAKPTRVFAEDKLPLPQPTSPISVDEDTLADPESPPTPTTPAMNPEPFASYARTNAWDEMPEIERYMAALTQHRRAKVQVLSSFLASGAPAGVLSPTEEAPGPRRLSLKLTDFPTEFERPSLPVTPAPVRRPFFWGDDRDLSGGTMPPAQGVPRQEDWNPIAKLDELQRRQSEVLLQGPVSPPRTFPDRMLPGETVGALLRPMVEETSVPVGSVVSDNGVGAGAGAPTNGSPLAAVGIWRQEYGA
jgi:glycogenin glucosyltransferase